MTSSLGMLTDVRLAGVKTDSLFAGLGAFDTSSGVMFTNGDEIQRAHWVITSLREGVTAETTELPSEVLRWLLADPLFVLSCHDPGPREWRRQELLWGPVSMAAGEERVDDDADEPFTHTAASIDRRLTYGRLARYNIHRFVAKDATAMNEAIKTSQRVQERSDGISSSNFGSRAFVSLCFCVCVSLSQYPMPTPMPIPAPCCMHTILRRPQWSLWSIMCAMTHVQQIHTPHTHT